jgi:hypothetical protein
VFQRRRFNLLLTAGELVSRSLLERYWSEQYAQGEAVQCEAGGEQREGRWGGVGGWGGRACASALRSTVCRSRLRRFHL